MKDKVYVITGPTGIGKTEVSLAIAKEINGEIINCDASQFKKDLNIGTAKIDLSNVVVPHYLIDIIDPESNYSIYDFQIKARALIKEINSRGKIPILVGGSGLYINACIYDYDLSKEEFRDEIAPDIIVNYGDEDPLNLPFSKKISKPKALFGVSDSNRIASTCCFPILSKIKLLPQSYVDSIFTILNYFWN